MMVEEMDWEEVWAFVLETEDTEALEPVSLKDAMH
jgi:hypothetical protein